MTTYNNELLDAIQVANDGQCVMLVVSQSIGHSLGCVIRSATHVTALSQPLLHMVVIRVQQDRRGQAAYLQA